MRKHLSLALTVCLSFAITGGSARSGELAAAASVPAAQAPAPAKAAPGEVTLKGTLGCGKCSFHEAKACQNVLKVPGIDDAKAGTKAAAKVDTYVLADNETSRANHQKVCGPPSQATVTGTVSTPKGDKTKGNKTKGRKILTASAINFD